jgi:hypothetical protein
VQDVSAHSLLLNIGQEIKHLHLLVEQLPTLLLVLLLLNQLGVTALNVELCRFHLFLRLAANRNLPLLGFHFKYNMLWLSILQYRLEHPSNNGLEAVVEGIFQ